MHLLRHWEAEGREQLHGTAPPPWPDAEPGLSGICRGGPARRCPGPVCLVSSWLPAEHAVTWAKVKVWPSGAIPSFRACPFHSRLVESRSTPSSLAAVVCLAPLSGGKEKTLFRQDCLKRVWYASGGAYRIRTDDFHTASVAL